MFNSKLIKSLLVSGKRVLIVGFGLSAVEVAKLLKQIKCGVVIVERRSESHFLNHRSFVGIINQLSALGVAFQFGIDGEQALPILGQIDLVVLSPGVSIESSILGTIQRLGLRYVAALELELALKSDKSVVITGTNGKSTTSGLLRMMLRLNGESARSQDVVQASSYQLEACTILKPSIGIILNIADNHLERHGSLERYARAKGRVLELQDQNDLAIVNADDSTALSIALKSPAKRALFGCVSESHLASISPCWALIEPSQGLRVSWNGNLQSYNFKDSRLMGEHNLQNAAAAVLGALGMGIAPKAIQEAINLYELGEHRLEQLVTDSEITIWNDSKSTTVSATVAALSAMRERFPEEMIVLMIGGLSKAGSWKPLLSKLQDSQLNTVSVVCFGSDRLLLAGHCAAAGITNIVAPDLASATKVALNLVRKRKHAALLFSPGCASFDEFMDYQQRGAEFKRLVGAY